MKGGGDEKNSKALGDRREADGTEKETSKTEPKLTDKEGSFCGT